MITIGIDPGSTESAFALVDGDYNVLGADKVNNEELFYRLCVEGQECCFAIESIQSYGMAVGRSVFDTCYMIGRIQQFAEDNGIPWTLYPRPEYARAIAGVGKVTDSVLRQSLLLRFGGDKKGEPLAQLKGNTDKRSAYAVAVYHLDRGGA